ncbi:Heat shock protein DnaJ [Cordyceps fumosorosea ARSEF 2679]|uniref:Heat shock protein DnaJ n=1 Tax=Cordyceps fumosorosea (strain ARSEF 2679) TaxID=1081104 RepID=A0A168EAB1_CORFA|nr:Heat shock protein DnaJ [Cordyceps fumosorosea ARSEF 2679]OAA73570.1 Heat shock protein DnaJ [Cordyceps fumosorosea ARSEF 2679]
MASKTSAAAALCSACRASLFPSPPSASPHRTSRRLPSLRSPTTTHRRRTYATTSSSSSSGETTPPPPPWPSSPHPTPYEIFGMARRDPYAKRRFHQLVKLYHPDTTPPPTSSSLSPSVRTERYRLVVAANDLLSDPSRRQLYDLHGAGWASPYDDENHLRRRDRDWRHQPGNAARNATWEDWEAWHEEQRWRQRHPGAAPPPGPVYMSNGLFAALVVAMCLVGALAQKNRALAVGEQYVEFAEDRNADIGRAVRRSASAAAGRSREERIDSFVRERENVAYRYRPGRYDDAPSPSPDVPGAVEEEAPRLRGVKVPPP